MTTIFLYYSEGNTFERAGLGAVRPDDLAPSDDEYDAYRKRMMLAYRFRPNPMVRRQLDKAKPNFSCFSEQSSSPILLGSVAIWLFAFNNNG